MQVTARPGARRFQLALHYNLKCRPVHGFHLTHIKLFDYTAHDTKDNRLYNYLRLFYADQYFKRH